MSRPRTGRIGSISTDHVRTEWADAARLDAMPVRPQPAPVEATPTPAPPQPKPSGGVPKRIRLAGQFEQRMNALDTEQARERMVRHTVEKIMKRNRR